MERGDIDSVCKCFFNNIRQVVVAYGVDPQSPYGANFSVMVIVSVSALGTELHIVEPDVKVNRVYYRETTEMRFAPDMRDISAFFIFQQDNVPSH